MALFLEAGKFNTEGLINLVFVDIPDMCCYLKPCWWLRFMLWLEAKLISLFHAAVWGHVDVLGSSISGGHVCDPCCGGIMLMFTICVAITRGQDEVWKSMIHAAANCHGQRNFFCSNIADCRLIMENERHWRFLWNPSPTKQPKTKEKRGGEWQEEKKQYSQEVMEDSP